MPVKRRSHRGKPKHLGGRKEAKSVAGSKNGGVLFFEKDEGGKKGYLREGIKASEKSLSPKEEKGRGMLKTFVGVPKISKGKKESDIAVRKKKNARWAGAGR